MTSRVKILAVNSFILALFILDRVLKYIFSKQTGEYFVLGDWFKLKFAANHGIAFGFNFGLSRYVLMFLCFFVLMILVWYLLKFYQQKKYFFVFCLTLILVGAFSNLLDRLYLGAVIDYFDLKYFTVFNLADGMILFGVIFIIFKNFNLRNKK